MIIYFPSDWTWDECYDFAHDRWPEIYWNLRPEVLGRLKQWTLTALT